ncbi:hypothetical protein FPV67DRAFT_1671695 [Lyophyllum atratum]|nr:hypothetical protein FPV67DRAFT_1671695 [Lyophyllum atratum]
MAQLAKIPCILAVTAALHVTHTAPATAPPKSKRPPKSVGERYLLIVQRNLGYAKAFLWALAVAEIIIIISSQVPESTHIRTMASALSKSEVDMNLRLNPVSAIGMLLITGGGLLRLQCYRTMNKFFTFEISLHKDHQLVTSGPYSVVRHPSYSAMVAIDIGMLCWYGASGSFLRESGAMDTVAGKFLLGALISGFATVLIALLSRMSEEDKLLRDFFGKAWGQWARETPYSLFPGVY